MRRGVPVVLLAALLAGACSPADRAKAMHNLAKETAASLGTFSALPVQVDDAYRIVTHVGTGQAEVIRSTLDVWEPGAGANATSAGLIAEGQEIFFPLTGYRRLDVDANDPQFGIANSPISFMVESRTGKQYEVTMGNQTPNTGGYYVHVAGDPHLYVVIPQVYDYVLGITNGVKVERPPDPRYTQAIAKLDQTSDPESVYNPWLAQVNESEGS